MTKNVEMIHIEELTDHTKYVEKRSSPNKSKAALSRFVHPEGKRVKDFVLEYLEKQPDKIGEWAELGEHIQSEGFKKSSINNGISRLLQSKQIKKVGVGKYQLVKNH
jgi:hypothetical protein